MATENLKKGFLNYREKIINILSEILNDANVKIKKAQYIPKGFTDNVFKIEVQFRNTTKETKIHEYIVKEYIESWHARESNTYRSILSEYRSLNAPNLIYGNDEFVILEYLNPKNYRNFEISDLEKLKDWIINKHNVSKNIKNIETYKEPLGRQIKYLIEKPLLTVDKVRNLKSESIPFKKLSIIPEISENLKDYIYANDFLPIILEHGDLEPQNILVNKKSNEISVIDWVNARASSGLFDINQYIETSHELGIKTPMIDDLQNLYSKYDFQKLLHETRILMLVNKINYYTNKLLNNIQVSESKGFKNLDLLNKYLDELVSYF